MISLPKTVVKALVPFFFALFLSGCASNTNFGLNADEATLETADIATSEVDDVELENIESKVCLDEELDALSQTGGWDEKSSPSSVALTDKTIYDFPVVLNNKVNMYLELFQNQQRDQFAHWLARSAIYRPMVEKELEKAGLPKDLFYLAMIESGYNQLACSRAKAVGLWQFMQATGKQYDLRINKYVDERRDPLKSTRAAISYLADLYKEFDDWYLAVAAYNSGPGTIRVGLKKHNVDNFWDLASEKYLSLETKRYVPKLIATLLIAKDPEKYGFTNISYAEPLHYDSITVGPGMSLEAIALISNSTTEEIKRLNRELRMGKTPLNVAKYEAKIPENSAELAKKNISRLHSIVKTGYKNYRVNKGDTLARISRRYNINRETLLRTNNLRSAQLRPGLTLKIPYSTISYRLLPEGSPNAIAAYKDHLILHRIKKGDTISKISRQYHVPQAMIVSWNGLKNAASIRAGQQLALYLDDGSKEPSQEDSLPSVTTFKADKKKYRIPDTEVSYERYSVQDGDSLWTISRKFSASTSEIKKWNNLTSDLIQPGAILILKKV